MIIEGSRVDRIVDNRAAQLLLASTQQGQSLLELAGQGFDLLAMFGLALFKANLSILIQLLTIVVQLLFREVRMVRRCELKALPENCSVSVSCFALA